MFVTWLDITWWSQDHGGAASNKFFYWYTLCAGRIKMFGKNKKYVSFCRLLKLLRRMPSVKVTPSADPGQKKMQQDKN